MSKCFPIRSSNYTLQSVAQMNRHLLDSWEQKNSPRGAKNKEVIAERFWATPMKSVQNFPKKMHHMLEKELYSNHALCTIAGMLMVQSFKMFLKEQELYSSGVWEPASLSLTSATMWHPQWGCLSTTLLSLSSPHASTFYYVFSKTYPSRNFKIAGEA